MFSIAREDKIFLQSIHGNLTKMAIVLQMGIIRFLECIEKCGTTLGVEEFFLALAFMEEVNFSLLR